MLKKIISGGQTGADQGGLWAGQYLMLETGGTAPYNWMTAEGPQQEKLSKYGLVPGPYDPKTYPKRTWLNVKNSDGTVIFGRTNSPGCKLTIKYCKTLLKPYIENPSPGELADWISTENIETLNVAGNREHTNPGITVKTREVIELAVRILQA